MQDANETLARDATIDSRETRKFNSGTPGGICYYTVDDVLECDTYRTVRMILDLSGVAPTYLVTPPQFDAVFLALNWIPFFGLAMMLVPVRAVEGRELLYAVIKSTYTDPGMLVKIRD